MTCVTEQVTGNDPIYTIGAIHIDNGTLVYIPFAGEFANFGMSHVENTPLFNINVANEYTVNVQLRVTAGSVNDRGMYWVILRRYKQRPANNTTRGTPFRDYYLGSSYYRDDTTAFNDIVLGGNVRVHFEGNDENFRNRCSARLPAERQLWQQHAEQRTKLDHDRTPCVQHRLDHPFVLVNLTEVGLSAGQQCPQQFFVFYVCRKRVNFGATRRTGPAHDWPTTRSTLHQLRHASVACPLRARAAFRVSFWACGQTHRAFRTGHPFLSDHIKLWHRSRPQRKRPRKSRLWTA